MEISREGLLCQTDFERMVNELFFEENYNVIPIEKKNDDKHIYVIKYPINKYPVDVVVECCKKLHKSFEAHGCTAISMPKDIDVSVFTKEQLAQMRDQLTELINNLSYNNIMN